MRRLTKRAFSSFDHKSVKVRQNKLLIDGQWVGSVSGETFASHNPYTEQELARVQKAGKEDVDLAVRAARRAFEDGPWRKMQAEERSRVMYRLADLMEKHVDELAVLESLDNGKPFSDARNIDVPMAINVIRYYAGWADKITGQTIPVTGPYFCFTRQEPVGVCAQIFPWNFPLALATWKLGPALATGCTTVMKPAEQTPLSVLRLGELVLEAGVPAGVVNILTGFGDVGQALVRHPDIDKVSFTGSTEVGREILASNGRPNIKRITLELGGKSANIVLADADVDLAIQQANFGLFFNQGQCCIAGSRTYVHEKVYDEFVEKSVKLAKTRALGDPFHKDTTQGPQISRVQQDRIHDYIEKGHKEGARALLGGERFSGQGHFVNPTIFVDVHDDMTIAKEEIFGPVMSVLKFNDVEDVIRRANRSHYGLGAGVVGRNMSEIFKIVKGLRTGTVYVNCYDIFQQATPFGGFKDSGLGRELGEAGLKAYLESKTVVMQE